jgi:hypothetical protein
MALDLLDLLALLPLALLGVMGFARWWFQRAKK